MSTLVSLLRGVGLHTINDSVVVLAGDWPSVLVKSETLAV